MANIFYFDTSFYLLFLAHISADYLFQLKTIAIGKKTKLGFLLLHSAIVGLVTFSLLLPFFSVRWLLGWTIVVLSHIVFDYFKICANKIFPKKELELGLLDQGLHVLVIFVVWLFFLGPAYYTNNPLNIPANFLNRMLLYVAGYIFIWQGGTDIVRGVLDKISDKKWTEAEFNAGKTIGCLERVLLLTFVLAGQYGAFGFVLAAKSIARFKELEEKSFAEYYLSGTLSSSLVALMAGEIIKWLV